jgi:hypothetical protein
MIKIIGVSGKMGTGKDYLSDNIIRPYYEKKGFRVRVMSFADHLKVSAAAENNLDIIKMYGDKTPEIRMMLQKKGTEDGRDKFGPNIWIKTLDAWIKLAEMRNEVDVVLIGDCRFKNEADWVNENGLLIRLTAQDRNLTRLEKESGSNKELQHLIANHISETDLDDYMFRNAQIIDNTVDNIDSVKENVLKCILFYNF